MLLRNKTKWLLKEICRLQIPPYWVWMVQCSCGKLAMVHNKRFNDINYLVRKRYITLLTKWQKMPVLICGEPALLIHANSLMFLFWCNLKLNFTLTLSECQAPNLSSLSAGVFERSPTSKFCKLNKKNRKIKVIELSISNSCRWSDVTVVIK